MSTIDQQFCPRAYCEFLLQERHRIFGPWCHAAVMDRTGWCPHGVLVLLLVLASVDRSSAARNYTKYDSDFVLQRGDIFLHEDFLSPAETKHVTNLVACAIDVGLQSCCNLSIMWRIFWHSIRWIGQIFTLCFILNHRLYLITLISFVDVFARALFILLAQFVQLLKKWGIQFGVQENPDGTQAYRLEDVIAQNKFRF